MRTKYNSSKTLGAQAARLVTTLHERGRRTFTLADVVEISGLAKPSARTFVSKLVARGVVSRLQPGLYNLVPFELGQERDFLGNPYLVAAALTEGANYYISHSSAMDIHGMTTQPQLVVYVTLPKTMRSRVILGTEFRFVRCKVEHFFGTCDHWMDKQDKVVVSDLERTVVDGLKHPEYTGGFSEVAKGFWMRRRDMDVRRLVDYALRLDVGAVFRRLGYLLETYGVDAPAEIERLRARLTDTYVLLDPLLLAEGKYAARWRLRLNVSPEELQAVIST